MARKKEYEDECCMAREIARYDAGDRECNDAIAQAILGSPEHEIVLSQDGRGNRCELVYHNECGPTCSLDDIFERMTLMDWRHAAGHAVERAVAAVSGGRFTVPRLRVSVTLVPERDSDVTSRVELAFYANRRIYEALLAADHRKNESGKREEP